MLSLVLLFLMLLLVLAVVVVVVVVVKKKFFLDYFFELISKRTNITYAKHCVMYKISYSNVNIYRKYYKSFLLASCFSCY